MLRALEEYVIEGVPTLIASTAPCSHTRASSRGDLLRRWSTPSCWQCSASSRCSLALRPRPAGCASECRGVELDGRRFDVKVLGRSRRTPLALAVASACARPGHAAGREAVVSPMQGTVLAVEVAEGDEVARARCSASSRR